MRAALIKEYGPSDVLKIEDIPRPEPGPKDVLIEVHATSVNPVDWKIRSGKQRGAIRYKLPVVLGMDVSGVVVEVGSQVTQFKPGDEVYSSPTHKRQGTYAEYVCIEESAVALKPKNITHEEAASIPLVGLTAWEAIVTKGKLQPGQKVLIQAGAGGVGSFAIQLAKAMGGYVITTCSTRNVEKVKALGADQVVDYTQENFEDVLKDIDLVVEMLGHDVQFRSRQVLRRGGKISLLTASLPANTDKYGPNLGLLKTGWDLMTFKLGSSLLHGVSSYTIIRPCDGTALAKITDMIEEGTIRPVVDRVYPLEEISDAHQYSETGRAQGKIVVSVKQPELKV